MAGSSGGSAHQTIANLHLRVPQPVDRHRLRLDEQALPPGLLARHIEPGVVEHVQDAEAVWRPEVGVVQGQRVTPVVAGRGFGVAKIVL